MNNTTNDKTKKADKTGSSSNLFVRLKNSFKKLRKSQKIQLITSLVLTLAVIVSIPTFAWFSNQKEMSVSTKINSPATLEIKSGGHKNNEQDIINFELSNIDTEDTSYKSYTESGVTHYYKDYVFCVKGKAISSYDLQLAHTTNIPFKYQIYQAVQDNTLAPTDSKAIIYESKNKDVTQVYRLARVKIVDGVVQKDNEDNIVYEDWNEPLDGSYVNAAESQRLVSDGSLTSRSYSTDDGDEYQAYADPVYWLKRNIQVYSEEKTDEGFTHSYVLRISWEMPDPTNYDRENINTVQNNKETDMIYITAAVS